MSKPRKEVKNSKYFVNVNTLYEVILNYPKTKSQLKNLLEDLLTPTELRMIKHRWYIANLLGQDKTVREVASQAKVGTDTVVRMAKKLKAGKGELTKIIRLKLGGTGRSFRKETKKKVDNKGIQIKSQPWIFGAKST